MRNVSGFILLLFLLVANRVGQAQSNFEYGARVGSSYSTFLTNRGFVTGGLGLIAGGMASYKLSESFQAIANLDYHQIRGGTQYGSMSGGTYTSTTNSMTLHTGEITGLVAYRLPLAFLGENSLRIVGGGSAAYNFRTSNTRSSSINGSLISTSNQELVTDSFAPWLYALQGGIQFEFPLSDGPFSATVFDFRYRRNLNPILNGLSPSGTGSASDIYAESFIMTFGLKLN